MGLLDTLAIDLTKPNPFPNICIYGDPGAGKTQFAAGAETPIAFLDYEASTETIASLVAKGLLDPESVKAFKPRNLNETKTLVTELIKAGFKTIVLDTVTRLQVMQMQDYIAKHPSVTGIQAPTGGSNKVTRDKYTVFQADYGFSYRILDEFLMWLFEQPVRVICNAHVTRKFNVVADGATVSNQLVSIQPNLTPKLLESAETLFSFIGYLTSKPGAGNRDAERKLRINPTSIITAKNRLNMSEQEITNPTYKGLFNV